MATIDQLEEGTINYHLPSLYALGCGDDGAHTEMYHRKIQQRDGIDDLASTSPLIVVVPGNPGVIAYYKTFIDHLYEKFDQKYEIIGIAHLGHGAVDYHHRSIHSVGDQIEHKIHVIDALLAKTPKRPLVFLGHSIGSYISLKVAAKQAQKYNILRLFHLFPTFRHLGRGLHPVVKVMIKPVFRHLAASFTHYCPISFIDYAIQKSGIPDEAKIVTTASMNYYVVLNILYMARTEEVEVLEMASDIQSYISDDLRRHYFFYGKTDRYTPLSFVDDLKAQFADVQVGLASDGVEHAFVLKHSKVVAEQLFDELCASLNR